MKLLHGLFGFCLGYFPEAVAQRDATADKNEVNHWQTDIMRKPKVAQKSEEEAKANDDEYVRPRNMNNLEFDKKETTIVA